MLLGRRETKQLEVPNIQLQPHTYIVFFVYVRLQNSVEVQLQMLIIMNDEREVRGYDVTLDTRTFPDFK